MVSRLSGFNYFDYLTAQFLVACTKTRATVDYTASGQLSNVDSHRDSWKSSSFHCSLIRLFYCLLRDPLCRLRYPDLNGINASVWQDLPLESDDKSPIVLIAKPFALPTILVTNDTATNATPVSTATKLKPTEDFFAASINLLNEEPIARSDNNSSPYETSISTYSFANFRKKFFSRLIPI